MTPNMTVSYMAEQARRQRLDRAAARGWQTTEAAETQSAQAGVPVLPWWMALVKVAASRWVRRSAPRVDDAIAVAPGLEPAG